VLTGLLEQRTEGLLRSVPRSHGVATRVREVLATRSELRDVSARRVARSLGLGVRTLARRLQNEQTSYRAVLDDVRRQAALSLLLRSEHTIADIADNLGFASPQGFQRAFRRWTGTSAAAYRRSQR
jgi:AraC-like DNA-binding protein